MSSSAERIAYQKAYYQEHKPECRERSKKSRKKLKIAVMSAYSGSPPHCQCCGELALEFLTIDHLNQGGRVHRASIGGPSYMYGWLKKQNYPEGFRVLCMNCNHAFGLGGYCPHQKGNHVASS